MIPQLRSFRHLHLRCLHLFHPRYYASLQSIKPKAVAFDMGGVVVPSPLPLFNQFEDSHGLQRGSIVSAINAGGERGNKQDLRFSHTRGHDAETRRSDMLQPQNHVFFTHWGRVLCTLCDLFTTCALATCPCQVIWVNSGKLIPCFDSCPQYRRSKLSLTFKVACLCLPIYRV